MKINPQLVFAGTVSTALMCVGCGINIANVPTATTLLSVACTSSTVKVRGISECSVATSGGSAPPVAWSASSGTIASNGLFQAPTQVGDVTIRAINSQDSSQTATTTISIQSASAQATHIVLVMEENESYSSVVGQTSAWPNLNALISQGSLATDYYANTHPSIGNYLMLTTGQVLTNDDTSTKVWNVDNLARRMLAANVSFKVYAEGITEGYTGGNTGLYVVRHNPFALLSDVAGYQEVANSVISPFSDFATDLSNNQLPEFSLIIPNLDDDAHNGTSQQADSWLHANVIIPLTNTATFLPGGDGTLIIGFDEAATSDTIYGGGHIATVLWGPTVKTGYLQTTTTVYQHQNMLATWIQLIGLSSPPGAANGAALMNEFFLNPLAEQSANSDPVSEAIRPRIVVNPRSELPRLE
jgi:hypothetical protein